MELLTLKRILAAVDLDGSSHAAMTSARDLARAAGAELHVVHVAGTDDERASVERQLEQMGISRDEAQLHVTIGDATRAINLIADRLQADLVVLGPHRETPDRVRTSSLGSTALAVVTNAAVPCLVTARSLLLPLDHVVVAIDLSDTANGTLRVALSWASALRARTAQPTVLTALHIMRAPSPEQTAARLRALENALAPIQRAAGDWAGVSLRTEIVPAETPAEGVANYAQKQSAALVALGTRGLGLDPVGRLGSVSEDVMRRIDLPILLVPPAVWDRAAAGG